MLGLIATSTLVASVTLVEPQIAFEDVELTAGRVVFVTGYTNGRVEREAYLFDPFAAGPENPTPFDNCYAAAVVTCGALNVKSVKFSQGPGDQVSCEFECKDSPPPHGT